MLLRNVDHRNAYSRIVYTYFSIRLFIKCIQGGPKYRGESQWEGWPRIVAVWSIKGRPLFTCPQGVCS